MHKPTSFLNCVTEGNGRNEGAVPFILCRALHSGRTALIGRHRRMSPDCHVAFRTARCMPGSASASSHTNLETFFFTFFLIFNFLILFYLLFILVYLFYYILLYFNIYLLNEEEEH